MVDNSAARMVDAAQAWLGSLDDDQRAAATALWPSEVERRRWYYTPTNHGGLPLSLMRASQQSLAMQLVATGLSRPGYVTATTIMGLENVLDHLEGWKVDWGRERGRDPQLYWLTVFGEPSLNGPWSWRFGGHHLSVHHLVLDGEVRASSPAFLGADPASSPLLGGHVLRPLGAAEDTARELVQALDEAQLGRALISRVAPVDIVGGNRPRISDGDQVLPLPDVWRTRFEDGQLVAAVQTMHEGSELKAGISAGHHEQVQLTTTPKGVAAARMTADQQQLLRAVLDVFIGRIPEELADREADKYAGEKLDEVHFAWAGGLERGQPHYYRLQGPHLLAEYDNTQRDVNHVHTVWRDPDCDFGDDVLARHLAVSHVRTDA